MEKATKKTTAKKKGVKRKSSKRPSPGKSSKEVNLQNKALEKIILRMNEPQRGIYFIEDVFAQEIAGCTYDELVKKAKDGSKKSFLNLVTINTELQDGEIKVNELFREENYVKEWWEKCSWHIIHKAMIRRVTLDYPKKNVKREFLRYVASSFAVWKAKDYTYKAILDELNKKKIPNDYDDVESLRQYLNRHGYKLGKRKRT